MMSFSGMPSTSTMFQAYASMAASIALFKTILNQLVPHQVQQYIMSIILRYFGTRSSDTITLVLEQKDDMTNNEVYNAAEVYLSARSSGFQRFKVSKHPKNPKVNVKFGTTGKIVDSFEGIDLSWRFVQEAGQKTSSSRYRDDDDNSSEKRYFELRFNKEHKDKILNCYIPYVLNQANIMSAQKKVIKLHSLSNSHSRDWNSVNLEHPSTFDTLALEPTLKKAILEDLDRFVKRKEFYRRIGKAWKRGYLLYGPPGTGKSSLIAAIANYLKFDIYDLEFSTVHGDSDLRKLMLSTKNKSILVIEDIDCSVEFPDRTDQNRTNHSPGRRDRKFTLAGFLNIIDGLWSSCGDERVIIFTTNHKEKLDPALLRPGRMDMHIHMSYLTAGGFKTLAVNYLEIHYHSYFQEIQELIESVQVTPAEVAEELMKSEDADVCLGNLVDFLKSKRDCNDQEEIKENGSDILVVS